MRSTPRTFAAAIALVTAFSSLTACIGDAPPPASKEEPSASDAGPAAPVADAAKAEAPAVVVAMDAATTPTPPPPPPPYSAATDPSMLAFWRFEDPPMSLAVADASNHLAPGMLAGNATFGLGKVGNGLHVNEDGWVNAGAIPAVADWTIALWIRPDKIEEGRTAFDMNYSQGFAAGPIGPRLSHEAAGLTIEVGTGPYMNMQSVKIVLATGFATAEWHHVVVTWSKNQLTGYFDGALKGTSPDLQPPTGFGDIQLGRGKGDYVQTRYTGFIDDVRVYGRALPADEALEVFQGKR